MNGEIPAALTALHAWAERVEYSAVGVAIAESRHAFVLIEGAHLIGLSVAIGLLFVIDLRLLGVVLRGVPAPRVLAALRPWVFGGFALIFLTGALLFWAAAGRLVQSPAFAVKLVLILLAGVNALFFEVVLARRAPAAGAAVRVPVPARAAALASLVLWTLVIAFGRLIPYMPSWA